MNKSEFYSKFEKYLQKKKISNSFMDKIELYNKMNEWLTNSKYTKKGVDEYEYHLVRIGKILMFKRFKRGDVKC